MVEVVSLLSSWSRWQVETYIPLGLELLQSYKRLSYRLVGDQRLVLLQRTLADLGVVGLWDGILEESFLELVDGDNDAEYFGKRVLQIAFGPRISELDFLRSMGMVS
jgi:hypothetical protein